MVTLAGPNDLVTHPTRLDNSEVHLNTLVLPELDALGESTSLWDVGRRTGRAIRHAVESVQPTDVLLTYLDHAQLALATGLRFSFPVRISGILFRPTLHELAPLTLKERMQDARKRILLRLASANPHLLRVLTHDPDAVKSLEACGLSAAYLPDPVEPMLPTEAAETVRAHFNIEQGRRISVLFGSLEERKGVFELLQALSHLAPLPASRLAVVIVGRVYDALRPTLLNAISQARSTSPAQIVFSETFLPEPDLVNLIAASDLVLAPYRDHIGSSGVVLRAAAAGRPVLAPNVGLMGREVRLNRLGVTVDTSDPEDIARGLADTGTHFDPDRAAAYAASHSVERFGQILFGTPR